jgi:hypothetical protein
MALNLGVLMLPADARVREDMERWNVRRTIAIGANALIEETVSSRARGASVIVFASPARRWSDVAEALRAAVQVAGGAVGLRFYRPDFLLGVRIPLDDREDRFVTCPTLELEELRPEGGGYFRGIYRIRRAVKDALADLIGAEMRAIAEEIRTGSRRLEAV